MFITAHEERYKPLKQKCKNAITKPTQNNNLRVFYFFLPPLALFLELVYLSPVNHNEIVKIFCLNLLAKNQFKYQNLKVTVILSFIV